MMEFFQFFIVIGLGVLASFALLVGIEWVIEIVFLITCLIAIRYFIKWLFNKKIEKF